jgi:hypothetical protein
MRFHTAHSRLAVVLARRQAQVRQARFRCNTKCILQARVLLLAVFFLLLPFTAFVYGGETVSSLLTRAQRLIANNRTPEALELLSRAAQLAVAMETRNLELEEEALWQSAMEHLNFAGTLENKASRMKVASRSHEAWSNYIEWYSGLDDTEISRLPRPNRRINKATAHLGNAAFMMGAPNKLLDEYSQYANFLGPEAVSLWKSALYACPNWNLGEDRSAATRAKKICDDSCKDHWITYAESLDDWLHAFPLRKAARASYSREVDQILTAARNCG